MAKVKYKEPSVGLARMIVKPENDSRPSLGMTEVKGEIYYLSPELIIPFKNQARKDFNEEGLLELASSIESQGIIQPLQIIHSQKHEGKFEVVSGERRLKAAKIAGLSIVPCMILDRDKDAEEIALIENIQREDLHPIELADAVSKLLEGKKHGSQNELANRIGISKSQMSHLVVISQLPSDVKKHFLMNKNIQMGYLRKIAYIKDEKIIREKVFNKTYKQRMYNSILRLSYNGLSFRIDQLKTDHLSSEEKALLKKELLDLLNKIRL
ncbi:MAG: ParB/RepB/Spo0J family partition protein [Thermodesulfobium sp.]